MRKTRWLIALASLAVAIESRADLILGYAYSSQSYTRTYTWQNNSYTLTQADSLWEVSLPSSVAAWILSTKGTVGDYYPVLVTDNGGSLSFYEFTLQTFPVWWADFSTFRSQNIHVYVGIAHRTGSSPLSTSNIKIHSVGTDSTFSQVLAADNDPTELRTFYVGSNDSSHDGIASSYIGRCNNGTWVSMGYGVDCSTCSPYVNSLSVSANGSVVTVGGNFWFGYNSSAPYEVDCNPCCSPPDVLYWHNDSSTTGHWSTSP